jgi:RecA DNA recombination protein
VRPGSAAERVERDPRIDPQIERIERIDHLRELLLDAGLADRVRVGASSPPPEAQPPSPLTHRTQERKNEQTPGTEEAFTPDVLLRPTSSEGRLIELTGERSSGRTALAYRLAALASARRELVGWVDLPNALDPRYLQRSGVRLEDVLWVRPPDLQAALRSAELLIKTGFALVVLDLEGAPARELARLGPSVWTRLLRALREARATAVLLGARGAAGATATLGVRAERLQAFFDAGLFEGLASRLEVLRRRAGPPGDYFQFSVYHRQTADARASAVRSA